MKRMLAIVVISLAAGTTQSPANAQGVFVAQGSVSSPTDGARIRGEGPLIEATVAQTSIGHNVRIRDAEPGTVVPVFWEMRLAVYSNWDGQWVLWFMYRVWSEGIEEVDIGADGLWVKGVRPDLDQDPARSTVTYTITDGPGSYRTQAYAHLYENDHQDDPDRSDLSVFNVFWSIVP